MEIEESQEALLSNVEVLHFLREERQRQFGAKAQKKNWPRHLSGANATILLETLTHLETQPCAHHEAEQVKDFLEAIKPFQLSQSEVLQIVNQVPESTVELHLLIEECEERLSEEQIEAILELVRKNLGPPVEPEAEQEDQGNPDVEPVPA
ncbi:hypothetical protein TCAL_12603 [Tigriopus californicus]|uniref:DNA-directed RNA polymerase III subunit RPC9 n=1 Tax=Tigriopus californicus TaxID=6832 RepID=A0A553NF19_TIGCA|nr:DNA-directed RNA polymerase III subunit RPC9-like [Tigriopus californicus]TRY64021.1 hypothetical protein TCAL_12603 [Tigriopus californicus]|eukprot:TCALIF_12603-PA protein Name:"Similar to CRCP DNA-directed RNA polymerase III subunit RPC9 (Homo sapiens)" AED:0.46 eAED:0.46 QI:0/-1/0/1/-1/1/1/0/150